MVNRKSATTGQSATKAAPPKKTPVVKCETCKFYKQTSSIFNHCHRYPDETVKSPEHWCGEWVEK